MKPMTDFEVRANNIEVAISGARHRVDEFGYEDDPSEEAVSRVIGMFICWLTACEEARLQGSVPGASFRRDIIDALPLADDPEWDSYIQPPAASSLRKRTESLWGIRIAFTHGDGDTRLIRDDTNRNYALDAPQHIPGVVLVNGKLNLAGCNCYTPIRTIVQIQDVLP